jgi:hypothetical protein
MFSLSLTSLYQTFAYHSARAAAPASLGKCTLWTLPHTIGSETRAQQPVVRHSLGETDEAGGTEPLR